MIFQYITEGKMEMPWKIPTKSGLGQNEQAGGYAGIVTGMPDGTLADPLPRWDKPLCISGDGLDLP
jgi:hypothetical protein